MNNYTSDVIEEDHYYPFGLTVNMTPANQSGTKNDIKFQNQRYESDFGLNMYSFKWRDHDSQLGRFWQVDALAEKYDYNSTYAFSENKVVSHRELEGLEAVPINFPMDCCFAKGCTCCWSCCSCSKHMVW